MEFSYKGWTGTALYEGNKNRFFLQVVKGSECIGIATDKFIDLHLELRRIIDGRKDSENATASTAKNKA